MIESASEFVRLRLSENREEYSRAANDAARLEVWTEVIAAYPDMREWVAHNKTVPISILELLAGDGNPSVRHAVAMKRKLTRQLFEALTRDPDDSVRARIAHNAKVPADLLQKLCSDAVPHVADAARSRVGA